MSVPQLLGSNSQLASGSSIGIASITVPATGFLEVYVTVGANTSTISSIATIGGVGFTLASAANDATDVQGVARYISNSAVAPGTYTSAGVNFSASEGAIGIAVVWVPNTTGQLASCSANFQSAPGTGVGALTTGSSGVLSSAPAILIGLTVRTGGGAGATSSAAGGSTQFGSAIWTNLLANMGFFEYQNLAATTSVAATFTSSNGTGNYISVGGVWQQNLVPQPFNPTQWFVNDTTIFQ